MATRDPCVGRGALAHEVLRRGSGDDLSLLRPKRCSMATRRLPLPRIATRAYALSSVALLKLRPCLDRKSDHAPHNFVAQYPTFAIKPDSPQLT